MPELPLTPGEVVFHRSRGGRVGIAQAAVDVLLRHRQLTSADLEAGGLLLGRLIDGTNDAVVDVAAEPNAKDVRRRFSFLRRRRPAQAQVEQAWRVSSGTRVYLGDWHSHPEDEPTPSAQDISNWRSIAASAKYEQPYLLFVIVGRSTMRMWELSRHGTTPKQCVPATSRP